MADTAFDTQAMPFRNVSAGDALVNEPPSDDQLAQVAQAPPPPPPPTQTTPTQAQELPVPRNVRAGDTLVNQPPPTALTTNTPAQQAQAAAPGGLTFVERPENEDRADEQAARKAELETLKGTPLEHEYPYRPLVAPTLVDPKQTPKWQALEDLRSHYPEMTRRDQKEAEATIRFEQNRIITETNLKNREVQAEYIRQQRANAAGLEAARSTPEALAKTSTDVEAARAQLAAEKTALLQSDKPDDKKVGDYSLKVSPLGTMKPADFSDAVAQFARLNQLTPRQAVQYGMVLGSPVDRNQQTGELLPGRNTLPPNVMGGKDRPVIGMGATAYTVVAPDGHGNAMVQMPDGKIIRVPLTTLDAFNKAREKGYKNSQKWWGDRKQGYIDAGKDDAVTRGAKWLYGKLQ